MTPFETENRILLHKTASGEKTALFVRCLLGEKVAVEVSVWYI
jgi:hypothetical protein